MFDLSARSEMEATVTLSKHGGYISLLILFIVGWNIGIKEYEWARVQGVRGEGRFGERASHWDVSQTSLQQLQLACSDGGILSMRR